MKTNLATLMNIVSLEEKNFIMHENNLKNYVYNLSIQELNGTINVLEDYSKDFEKEFRKFKETQEKISKLKAIIYEKNNAFHLSDGRTIQEAIVDNSMLRKMKNTYEFLLLQKNLKRRITEVNNSYFECRNINYSHDELSKLYKDLENKINETDFEISKLNSIEFEIEL